jgi:hypothetical protein
MMQQVHLVIQVLLLLLLLLQGVLHQVTGLGQQTGTVQLLMGLSVTHHVVLQARKAVIRKIYLAAPEVADMLHLASSIAELAVVLSLLLWSLLDSSLSRGVS